MGIKERMAELQREADEAEAIQGVTPFSRVDQRAIIKMALHPSTQKFIEPVMEHLDWSMFDQTVEKACFNEIKSFWSEHDCLATKERAVSLLDRLKQSVTTDDADFQTFYDLFNEKLNPSEVPPVRAGLDKWVKTKLWTKAVGSTEAIEAVQRGDFDTVRRLVAEAEGGGIGDEKEVVLDFLLKPQDFLSPDSVKRLTLSQPTLTKTLGSGGPSPGEVLTYLGRTAGGKSLMLANDAVASAMHGQNTLLVTFEISRVKMAQRCASILTGIDTDQLLDHSDSVVRQCRAQFERLGSSTLKIVHLSPGRWSVNKVRQLIKKMEQEQAWRPEVVLLDYMELMMPRSKAGKQQSEYEKQKEVANDLSFLASEESVFVISATQANREGVKNQANVGLQHIAESYGKAMSMDYIVSLNQTEEEKAMLVPELRLSIVKNREGECRSIPTTVNYRTKKITEVV